MIQTSQTLTLRKQFRIGSCNFALEACKWKSFNFRQKTSDNDFSTSNKFNTVIPNVRLHHTSVVLSDHIYMFGGVPQTLESKSFCAINLKNNKWHDLRISSNPSLRDLHGLAVLQQQIYMFGGSNRQSYFNDLYSFNTFTNGWRQIQNKGVQLPQARDSFIFLSVKNEYLLLIGGINLSHQKKYFEDVFIWKNGCWKVLGSNFPKHLIDSRGVQVNGRVFIFGGISRQTGQESHSLYELIIDESTNQATFKQVKLSINIFPEARLNHQLLKVNNQYFLLIGGQSLNKKVHKDIWIFDLFSSRWTRVEPKNGPLRGIHSFSAVMHNNVIFLIGGFLQNRKQVNDQVLMIQFANQEIFKSEVCENCVNLLEKRQHESKKFPKDLVVSVGFLYNMALQIKFPFHAISMIYEGSKYLKATTFRITSQKTLNNFNFLRMEFNGCSFGRQEFMSFISHQGLSPQLKKFTENVKLGALRLGKTFLFVSSDIKFRYVYLLSAESRVSPHFDEAYIYYAYIQNIELQRIETEEGVKQRQLILNILSTHLTKPQILLSKSQKSLILIFENKVVMSSEKDYICELEAEEYDIKVWKNDKKVQFLQQRGYHIRSDLEISLRSWMTFYYFSPSQIQTQFYFNENEQAVRFIKYKQVLDIYAQKGIIEKVQLLYESGLQFSGEIYITQQPHFLQNNYGLLIYSKGHLYSRFDIDFGKLFPQNFYKSKYKQAKTIFYELGFINITKGLQENLFKNGFNQSQKYSIFLEKIQQKCDQKRAQLNQKDEQEEESKTIKKVKI